MHIYVHGAPLLKRVGVNVNTTDAKPVLRHCYCPLRIHTPYTTPYETRSMRALAALMCCMHGCMEAIEWSLEHSGLIDSIRDCGFSVYVHSAERPYFLSHTDELRFPS